MGRNKKPKRRLLWLVLFLLIVAQFKRIDKTNPPIVSENDFVTLLAPTVEIENILKNSCYDCHSNTTRYPWYTNIAPVSWWIRGHIDNAREHVNFSEWGEISERERAHNLEECIDMVDKEWMPIGNYARMHGEAKLTRDQRDALIAWMEIQL